MKIYVIPSWYPPNGGEFFRVHSQALAAGGIRVTVLAAPHTSMRDFPLRNPSRAFSTAITEAAGMREIIRPYYNIPLVSRQNALGWIRMMVSFAERQFRKDGVPDLLQVHSSMWAGVVAARLGRRHGIPVVITEHRSRFVYNTPEAKALFLPWHEDLLQEAFTAASQIITVSPALNERIFHYLPDKEKHILTIPNMVDTDFFVPAPTPINRPGSDFTFFALAHHIALKGFDTLLDAFARAAAHHSTLKLIIGGSGPETFTLKKQCHSSGLDNRVTFTGALNANQVREFMQQADAFVLPSRFEAFGVVFIEAMACGIPVIAARAGGPESFITPATGMLVPPDAPRQLAEAMLEMAATGHFRSEEIRQVAVEQFSPKAIAGKYLEIYQQILKNKLS